MSIPSSDNYTITNSSYVRKDITGRVDLHISISNGHFPQGLTTIATIPDGFRPKNITYLIGYVFEGANREIYVMYAYNDGRVAINLSAERDFISLVTIGSYSSI